MLNIPATLTVRRDARRIPGQRLWSGANVPGSQMTDGGSGRRVLNCQRANPEGDCEAAVGDVVPGSVVASVWSCVDYTAPLCPARWRWCAPVMTALLAGDYRHAQWAVAGRLNWSLTVLAAVAFIARGIFHRAARSRPCMRPRPTICSPDWLPVISRRSAR